MSSREDNIYYARLAEQGERYEDMIRYMKEVANVSALSIYTFDYITKVAIL
jgi:hypothetical protein